MTKTSAPKEAASATRPSATAKPRVDAAASTAPPYGIGLADEAAPPLVHDVLRSPGQPLDAGVRAQFEAQLGRDFSGVRVHTDERAAASARAVDALAYAVGSHAVFDRGAYRPDTLDGRALLAHELTHVAQNGGGPIRGPLVVGAHDTAAEREAFAGGRIAQRVPANVLQRTPPGARPRAPAGPTPAQLAEQARVEAETVARDYTDGQTYVTDFYSTAAEIHRALVSATHRAINRFTETSQILDSRLAANLTYNLVRIVLGILPGSPGVIALFDALRAGTTIAANGARLATIAGTVLQRSAAATSTGIVPGTSSERQAAVHALDSLSTFDTDGAAAIEAERARARQLIERDGTQAMYRGHVRADAEGLLGAIPVLSAPDVRRYEVEYELGLYREYYGAHGSIVRSEPFSLARVYTTYTIRGVPEAVQARVVALYRAIGRVPQVAIDLRFLGQTTIPTAYGDALKCLIDLGIPVVGPAYGGTPQPVTLHTGDDLRMPYRGSRFAEVQ